MRLGVPLQDEAHGRLREVGHRRLERLAVATRERADAGAHGAARSRTPQNLCSSSMRIRLCTSGQWRSPCGLRAQQQQTAGVSKRGARADSRARVPVELPLARFLLRAEEVPQRGAARLLHVPEDEQRAAADPAACQRVLQPDAAPPPTHSGSARGAAATCSAPAACPPAARSSSAATASKRSRAISAGTSAPAPSDRHQPRGAHGDSRVRGARTHRLALQRQRTEGGNREKQACVEGPRWHLRTRSCACRCVPQLPRACML